MLLELSLIMEAWASLSNIVFSTWVNQNMILDTCLKVAKQQNSKEIPAKKNNYWKGISKSRCYPSTVDWLMLLENLLNEASVEHCRHYVVHHLICNGIDLQWDERWVLTLILARPCTIVRPWLQLSSGRWKASKNIIDSNLLRNLCVCQGFFAI